MTPPTVPTSDACDGRCGRRGLATYRLSTGGGGGVYLCERCWAYEMAWRRERNRELDHDVQYDILPYPGREEAPP